MLSFMNGGRVGTRLIGCVMAIMALPSASTAATYYIAPWGCDRDTGAPPCGNDGSEAAPWRSFAYGVDRLNSGDTLRIFPGHYDASGDVRAVLQNKHHITIEGYNSIHAGPWTPPLIDGTWSMNEFPCPSGGWEAILLPQPSDEPCIPPTTIEGGGGPMIEDPQPIPLWRLIAPRVLPGIATPTRSLVNGWFEYQGRSFGLVNYSNPCPGAECSFLSTDENYSSAVQNRPVYVGPGIFYDTLQHGCGGSASPVLGGAANALYLRLQPTAYMRASFDPPELAELENHRSELRVRLAGAHARLDIHNCHNLTIQNVNFRGYRLIFRDEHPPTQMPATRAVTLKSISSENAGTFIEFQHRSPSPCVMPESAGVDPGQGLPECILPASHIIVDDVHIRGVEAPWIAYSDIKQGSYDTATGVTRAFYAHSLEYNSGIVFEGDTSNITVTKSSFTDLFIGLHIAGPARFVDIIDNDFAGLRSDAIYLGSAAAHVEVAENDFIGVASAVSRVGGGDPAFVAEVGTKWIHHNTIDTTVPFRGARFSGAHSQVQTIAYPAWPHTELFYKSPFSRHHGQGFGLHGDPRWIYHNTVVFREGPLGAGYGLEGVSPLTADVAHHVYNNVFVQTQPGWPMNINGDYPRTASMQVDGNLFWRSGDPSAGPLWTGVDQCVPFVSGCVGLSFADYDQFKSYVGVYGWQAVGGWGDPQLDSGYRAGPLARLFGVVLNGFAIPGIELAYLPYCGRHNPWVP